MFVEANMNMVRIWGGGIYENDYFYQICDQMGIMVWQDFMFACGRFPEDQEFLQNVKEEVRQNVSRLQFHPSLAIWCGNNENEWIWTFDRKREINKMPGYPIYHEIIPKILENLDPTRPYWPSSPFGDDEDPNDPASGNRHQWDIWSDWEDFSQIHSDKSYFVTEFGFQGPANLSTIESVIPVEQRFPQSRLFEYHNKQEEGNERLFRFLASHFPVINEWEDFIYLTQLNQAIALKTCVDHWRYRWPDTAGSIIWQYNDCWPVTSWSLIDYHHRPKISYYFIKNAFEPVFTLFKKRDQGLDILIHNQDIHEFNGFLNIYILENSSGQVISQNSIPVSIVSKSKEKFHQIDISEYPKQDWTIVIKLVSKHTGLVHQNYYTEGPWKHKKLPKTQIKMNIISGESGARIELNTDKAGYFVDLYHPEYQFSDRGFMLLPGEKKQLKIVSNGKGKIDLNKIKIFALNHYLTK
jgi:beta-mannosidase